MARQMVGVRKVIGENRDAVFSKAAANLQTVFDGMADAQLPRL
jgi:hypothetical protein